MMTAVVVGAGLSGVLATRELLRAGWPVVLVDPGARPGRGVAYGTVEPWHLLNSPAASMSADADDPGQFVRWCQRRDPSIEGHDFVRRDWYGDYLTETLRSADELNPGGLTVHRGRVVRIFEATGEGLTVLLADNVVIPAEKVVLAVGNPPPTQTFPGVPSEPAYVPNPWVPGALSQLPDGPVLLIGTGLTAVDAALTLAHTGRHAQITAVSRHALLPRPHAVVAGAAKPGDLAQWAAGVAGTNSIGLSAVLRAIRERAGAEDWRRVLDALRPHWNVLWRGLSEADRQRFLRHVARHWEVHRHRMAPVVAARIEELRERGTLRVERAEVCGLSGDGRMMRAALRVPIGIETREYAAVVNCTGPGRLIEVDPLVRSLIADGLAQPGPFGLGLDTDETGALLGRSPRRGQVYTLGHARRGVLWETTAAPEIRAQARQLAATLTALRPAQRPATDGVGALGSCRADSAYPLPG
jgi:uncharacterized NAD(P)/FAD-binding protein YdhS